MMIFFIIAVISIFPLYLNYSGDYYTGAEIQSNLDYFTLGNEYGLRLNSTDTLDVKKNNYNYLMIWSFDIANSSFFLVMIFILFLYGYITIRKALKNSHKTAEYAIEVKGIPKIGVDKNDIKNHFSQFGDIEEVYLGRRYYNLLYYYTLRSKIIEELKIRETLIQFKNIDGSTDKILSKLKLKLQNLDAKIKASSKIIAHDELEIKRAYIIFNRKQDKIKCLKEYNKNRC